MIKLQRELMREQERNFFLKSVIIILLLQRVLVAVEGKCLSKEDLKALDLHITSFNEAIQRDDLNAMSTFMNFPITDNYNHVITKRVFLKEDSYQPVINVRKVLKESLPMTMHDRGIQSYQYLDECNKYVVENLRAEGGKGLRFIFKKIGKLIKLKLIRPGH